MAGIRLLPSFLFIMQMMSSSADQKIIPAESGQNVTLTCRTSNNNTINIVEWSRADLGEKYVLSYRDGHFLSDHQHPSFKNRVDLQDRQMKDGDVSLILNNVTINDTGTYECRVFIEETRSWEFSIISLHVDPPGQPGGLTGAGGKEAGAKEAGGKEAGGKGAGEKGAGEKEAGGKGAGGKKAGVSRGHPGLVAVLLAVVFVAAAVVVTIKLKKKTRLCPACDKQQLV